jgi:hypothetical protein
MMLRHQAPCACGLPENRLFEAMPVRNHVRAGEPAAVAELTQCVTETAGRFRSNSAAACDMPMLRTMIVAWSASTGVTGVGSACAQSAQAASGRPHDRCRHCGCWAAARNDGTRTHRPDWCRICQARVWYERHRIGCAPMRDYRNR